MDKKIQIRVLHTDGCPNAFPVIDLIRRVGDEIDIPVSVERVLVSSQKQAVELRFIGSPTVEVNGVDIDPAARGSVVFSLG